MRKIKFRAWDKVDKKMLYTSKDLVIFPPAFNPLDFSQDRYARIVFCRDKKFITVHSGVLMQFTGLVDASNKEIYEGDIVRVDCYGDQTIHKIIWETENDYPAFELEPGLDCECNGLQYCVVTGEAAMEIVGNVYENPELLK